MKRRYHASAVQVARVTGDYIDIVRKQTQLKKHCARRGLRLHRLWAQGDT